MRAVWRDPEQIPSDLPTLHGHRLVHELLARRGIRSVAAAADFLDPRRRHAPDDSAFPNLPAAIERIAEAVRGRQQIGIFGDYDADGVTATALLVRALRTAGERPDQVIARLPHRQEGYGLNRTAIDEFAAAGVTLMIAVDCGSSDPDHVAYARSLGMDVVVLDHHQLAGPPPAGAIVATAQLPGGEPFVDLCSAGIAYLVAVGLARDGLTIARDEGGCESELLDLVALGSIADVVNVSGINRPLIRDGLAQVRTGKRVGLQALAQRAVFALRDADAELISFKVGPRLNAAGRMADPRIALELLLADDPSVAARLAEQVEQLNDRRKVESATLLHEAEQALAADPVGLQSPVIIVRGLGWPSGLLGPVSAKLAERHGRPAIVLSDDGEGSHGSARSVPGFDITAALRSAEDLLTRFGGHGQAAGLALANWQLPALRERLEQAIAASDVPIPTPPAISIDADLEGREVNVETAEAIARLAPFGPGNAMPVLRLRDVGIRKYDTVGQDRRHLRLHLELGNRGAKAIAFGMAERSRELLVSRRIDLAAYLKVDQWDGQKRVDLQVVDFRPSK